MEEVIDMALHKPKKLRVLCFHGYYNNIEVMKYQFEYYEHIFKEYIEFEYINGFYENYDIFDLQLYSMFKGKSFYSWAINDDISGKPKGFRPSLEYVIDYMNRNGPYDGILGFSQGTFLVRTLLKLDEFKTELPKLDYPPNFGIIVSGPLRLSVSYTIFNDYPQDKYKYLTAFKQPVLYMYGEKDIYIKKIEFGIIREGEYDIIKHNSGHNVPKLINEQMDQFIDFMDKQYFNKYGEKMKRRVVVDEEFKKNFTLFKKTKDVLAKI